MTSEGGISFVVGVVGGDGEGSRREDRGEVSTFMMKRGYRTEQWDPVAEVVLSNAYSQLVRERLRDSIVELCKAYSGEVYPYHIYDL